MNETIVKVAENPNEPPTISQIKQDKDTENLGLLNTTHTGSGHVP